jgi:hypothetical protein
MPRLIQVIESDETRGLGRDFTDTCRRVRQYHTTDGELLAEVDPWPSHNALLSMIGRYVKEEDIDAFVRSLALLHKKKGSP